MPFQPFIANMALATCLKSQSCFFLFFPFWTMGIVVENPPRDFWELKLGSTGSQVRTGGQEMSAMMTVAKCSLVDCSGESFENCLKKMLVPGLHLGWIKLESLGLSLRCQCFVLIFIPERIVMFSEGRESLALAYSFLERTLWKFQDYLL